MVRNAVAPAREHTDPHQVPRLRTKKKCQKSAPGGSEEEEEIIYIRSSMEGKREGRREGGREEEE